MKFIPVRNLGTEPWFRAVLVAGAFGLSAYLGLHASTTYLAALLAIGAGLILLAKPEWGYLGLLVGAMSVPFGIGTGTQTELPLPFLLVPVLFFFWLLKYLMEKPALVASRAILPLVVFVLCCVISFVSGNLPWSYFAATATLPAQLGELALMVFSPVLLFVAANQLKDLRWLKGLCALMLAYALAGVLLRAAPELESLIANRVILSRATDGMFWVWAVALAAGQALFNRQWAPRWRTLLLILAITTFGVGWLFWRYWVSGWLPPLVGFAVLVWLWSPRYGAGLTLLALAIFQVQYPDALANLVELKAYSIDTRLDAWRILIENIIPANPILGLGPANYYFDTPLFPILGYYVNFNSHNQYLDIVLQLGLVGLAALGWLLLALARVGWSLRERVGNGFARGYVYGCLGGLAGTLWAGMHGDWFLPFVYNVGIEGFRASMLPWLFLGGLVAIEQMRRTSDGRS